MRPAQRISRPMIVLIAAGFALAGCGGGGGGGGSAAAPRVGNTWVAGAFLPSASFAGKCVNPRSGTDPAGQPYNEVRGTATDENNWLRSWSNELYLWYSEIADRDPALYPTDEYFRLLKTTAFTPSGHEKDRFHFTYPTAEWIQLVQSGVEAGYGAAFAVVSSLPPRRIVVAYTEPGSPASLVTPPVERGEEVIEVDGVDVVLTSGQAEIERFVAGLYPASVGESHSFTLRQPRTGTLRAVTMQSAAVATTPVRYGTLSTATGTVGYMLFNDHLAPAEQALIDAIESMRSSQVTDLVIDLRYNGGGLLAIASELAYMIAGPAATAGQTFELDRFNDKYPSINPVTGAALTPMPFLSTAVGFSAMAGQPLPTLNLPRVYVLTGGGTCSASESIINGLRGVNVEVIQIGSTTCGKPYGFYPADHCGTTYFTVQFQGVNAQSFGDYPDGFSPSNTADLQGVPVTGCSVGDDFSFALGDPNEARLAAALAHRNTRTCPTPSGIGPAPLAVTRVTDGIVAKSPWLTNRWLETPR
jgi:carboxyl-terminal processing protease